MANFLADLRTAVLALSAETEVHTHKEPDSPPACLTLYATGGPQATPDFDGNAYGPRTAQFRVRDPDARQCEARLDALYALFAGIRQYAPLYLTMQASSAPFYGYPQDADKNFIGSMNLWVIRGS